jgi:predicted esterase
MLRPIVFTDRSDYTQLMLRIVLPSLCLALSASAQLTQSDTVFAGLTARTEQLAYTTRGGDMAAITPLMTGGYRGLTHAMVVMGGTPWSPDAELPTALDFALNAKVVGTGDHLNARATFVFDAPAAANGPYKMRLDLVKADGSTEGSIDPGITLGDVRGRHEGEMVGLTFVPSKSAQPGLHVIRATLEDGSGKKLYEYYRSFWILSDLAKRTAALDKTLELLSDQKSPAALEAREVMETIDTAEQSYYAPGFQGLTGFVFTRMRAAGLGLKEPMDFEAGLTRATLLATSLKEGSDPSATAKGDLFLAYRSSFDGKLVPYRVYLPTSYTPSKKYPLIVLLHGAGGDETDFIEAYRGQWPQLAEQHGFILASVTGRGPLSGYSKVSGGEQDVLDVMEIVKNRYSVDSSKIFLGGHSMGGGGTWAIGLAYQDKFAGFIPIAPAGNNPALMSKLNRPTMLVCGVKDALIAVASCRGVAEKAKELNVPLKYSEYADGDHLSVAVMAVPDIFTWLDQQTKSTASSGGHE